MFLMPTDFPNMSSLERLKIYVDDPSPVKGIDFVCPLALRAIESLKDSKNNHSFRLDSNFNLEENMEEV